LNSVGLVKSENLSKIECCQIEIIESYPRRFCCSRKRRIFFLFRNIIKLSYYYTRELLKPKLIRPNGIDHDGNPYIRRYFTDTAGSEVKFDEHGDGLARYEILNFRKGTNSNGANGYHYRVRLIPSVS